MFNSDIPQSPPRGSKSPGIDFSIELTSIMANY